MDAVLHNFFQSQSLIILLLIILVSFYTLSKGADILVDQAVSLSIRWGIPKMVIGATIVSLGTTLPEATVSVLAAINGNPDMALGNAIGSIICDTGLIIGISALIGTLPVDKKTIDRQGWVQIAAGILLAVIALPFRRTLEDGSSLHIIPQWVGFLFLVLLAAYLFIMMKWSMNSGMDEGALLEEEKSPVYLQLLKLVFGVFLVIFSSKVLIGSVEVTALKIGIPQAIIAATLVAFGTSLPELMTAVTSVRKGHGELAIGNIIGADILNVLFVVGASAAATANGLIVPLHFYYIQIPTMLIILVLFRYFCKNTKDVINKKEGALLLGFYAIYLILNFTVKF
ncbi:calcium/sodium antiporter [Clostridiales bacterium COT073_COT-073]|nr:calcium/sodium antiporter [Clostridiales bacterium COT073_COT-073]